MKCKIKCPVHDHQQREWEVTSDARVWPCCYYANLWEQQGFKNKDNVMFELLQADPNWNSLEKHSLNDITEHTIYKTHLWFDGWESDNPSPICVEECEVYVDNVTGKKTAKSNLYAKGIEE